jgi:predicted DNA-binding protein (MmcQ/YjbR family)
MKIKTLIGIYDLLKQNKNQMFKAHNDYRDSLIYKYGDYWYAELTESEKQTLDNLKEEYNKFDNLITDLENHEW